MIASSDQVVNPDLVGATGVVVTGGFVLAGLDLDLAVLVFFGCGDQSFPVFVVG